MIRASRSLLSHTRISARFASRAGAKDSAVKKVETIEEPRKVGKILKNSKKLTKNNQLKK